MVELVSIDQSNLCEFIEYIPSGLISRRNDDMIEFRGISYLNNSVGIVISQISRGRLIIYYLYIDINHRNQGIARNVLRMILEDAYSKGCILVETSIIPGKHEEYEGFLDALDVIRTDEHTGYMFFKLSRLKNVDGLDYESEKVIPLVNVSDYDLRVYAKQLREQGMSDIPLNINKSDYMQQCSCAYMEKSQLTGMLLINNDMETVSAACFVATSEQEGVVAELLAHAYNNGIKQMDGDIECQLPVANEKMELELERMLGLPVVKKQKLAVSINSALGR